MPPRKIKLYSTQDAARELGISIQRVKQIREDLDVGQVVARSLVFTEYDIERMRQRNTTPGPKGPRTPKENAE